MPNERSRGNEKFGASYEKAIYSSAVIWKQTNNNRLIAEIKIANQNPNTNEALFSANRKHRGQSVIHLFKIQDSKFVFQSWILNLES